MQKSSPNPNIWHAASYTRLSKEDQVIGESDSILGQRRLIEDWVAKSGHVQIVANYSDDGYTGANFERPGFKKMMTDAAQHHFDTIIVKDLSRFGRSYLDCGALIERLLPNLGIRLYSISDNFDSMASWDYNTALLLPIKNLMNEMHVITTSEKVRTSLNAKRRRGEFVGNYAPYGYAKDQRDHHRLVVDAKAAEVVRLIFVLFAQGKSASSIARYLNSRGTPSPSAYRKLINSRYNCGFAGDDSRWHSQTVIRILRNDVYAGNLVQGKTRKTSWRSKSCTPLPQGEWIICEHTHEALITRDLKDKVEARLREMDEHKSVKGVEGIEGIEGIKGGEREPNGSSDTQEEIAMRSERLVLTCSVCGGRMHLYNIRSGKRTYRYFICRNKRANTYSCNSRCIRAELVFDVVANLRKENPEGHLSLSARFENGALSWSLASA